MFLYVTSCYINIFFFWLSLQVIKIHLMLINLLCQGNFGQALQNLRRLYRESQAIRIFNKMRTSIDARSSFQHFWTPFTEESFKSALFTSISIQMSHIIGAKVVSSQGYLETATSDTPLISAFVQLLGSIVTTLFVVDKFGRKTILIVSLVVAAILFLALSIVSYNSAQFVPLVQDESSTFGAERVCAAYRFQTISWSCITCLQNDCGFCASPNNQVKYFRFYLHLSRFLCALVESRYQLGRQNLKDKIESKMNAKIFNLY